MNRLFFVASFVVLSSHAFAQGTAFTYQGRLNEAANPANGIYDLRLSLFDAFANGAQQGNTLTNLATAVSNGLFTLTLDFGNQFPGANRWLEIGVRTNGGGAFATLNPRQQFTAAPYAITASNLSGMLPASQLSGTLASAQLADSIALGATNVIGQLDVYRTSANTPAITLFGGTSQISTYGADGQEQIRLWGPNYGELLLKNSLANNATAVNLTAQGSTGGRLTLNNTNGSNRAILEGENTGGTLTLYTADGNPGAILYGNEGAGSGTLSLRNTNGNARFRAYGGPSSGRMLAYNTDGQETVDIDAEPAGIVTVRNAAGATRASMNAGGSQGGEIRNYKADGTLTTSIHNVSDAGVVSVRNASGQEMGYLWGRNLAGQTGGQIGLKNSSGLETIILNADSDGKGRITSEEIQVTSATTTLTNGATLTPTTGYMRIAGSGGAVTLNATTAIANGSESGLILILEGTSAGNTVTIPNSANTIIGANRTLGLNDTLTLIWNGANWVQLAFSNN